jgi:3-deoxy-D-manno-octulosonate 8-phosphate phosphatase (KDO 8-P phosphatase)
MNHLEKFEQVTAFIFDIDGVLTNGQLVVQNDGSLLRQMNIKDGYAMQLAIKKNYPIIIISGAKNIGVEKRLQGLGISHIYLGIENKWTLLSQLAKDGIVNLKQSLYMGDDMPDFECMQHVLLPCCPADACSQVFAVALYASAIDGGYGCARDVIEKVLTLQSNWE